MPLNDTAPVLRRRLAVALLAGALMVPAPAFAQGAGDDQYRDPFPETTAQSSPSSGSSTTSTTGQGLSQTPPTSSTQGSGSAGTSSGSGASTGSSSASEATTSGSSTEALARTGDDPWLVALAGAALLALGAGIRLRGGAQRRH